MGTRHLQTVIAKDGEVKIQQYGQWDGYPDGQGVDILTYLRNGNLKKYQQELGKIHRASEEQLRQVDLDPNWKSNYPYMGRDCGSRIHQMIEEGNVRFVQHITESEALWWCEGFYTIDFQKELFITLWRNSKIELPLDNLPTVEDYKKMFIQ